MGQEGIGKSKERIVSGQAIFFLGGREQQGSLSCRLPTSLVLIKKFQIVYLKVTFLEVVETASKSWFAVIPGGK